MIKKVFLLSGFVFAIAIGVMIAHPTYAATTASNNFVPLTQFPAITSFNANTTNLSTFFNTLYKSAIGVASVLAFLMIIYAGFTWMSAGDNTEQISKAKKRIQDSLFGLVLVLSPTIVFGIINPNVLNVNLNFGGLAPTTPAATPTPAPVSAANPPASIIQATGQANPACTTKCADGTVIPDTAQADQCCNNQTGNGVTCVATWNYNDINNPLHYCSCSKS